MVLHRPAKRRRFLPLLCWAASAGLHLLFLLLVFHGPPASLPQPRYGAHQVELIPDPEPIVAPRGQVLHRAESLRSVAIAKEPRRRFSMRWLRSSSARAAADPGEPTPFVESFAEAPDRVPGPEERRDDRAGLSRKDGAAPVSSARGQAPRSHPPAAIPVASGTPGYLWLNDTDRRYADYFREIYRKVDRLWRFPKSLEVLFEQGDVLVQFMIEADGNVREVRVRKSSGYEQFDRNVVAAIRQAAPFGPIPQGLGRTLRVLAPFEFSNPMVR